MFRFIVKYLGFLKHVPFFSHWMDSVMMIWNMLFNREVSDSIEQIENDVALWAGVTCTLHKFGGLQFNYNTKEVGHIHSNGILDILFTRTIKQELIRKGLVSDHHVLKKSGWISYRVRSAADLDTALYLLRLSYERLGGCSTA